MTATRSLSSYAGAINLHAKFDRISRTTVDEASIVRYVAEWLMAEHGATGGHLPHDSRAGRHLIRQLLTLRPPHAFPSDVLRAIDDVFAAESAKRPATDAARVLVTSEDVRQLGSTHLAIWRGDITTLALDAIVNAANADLLGCFHPGHTCIDNAIHSASGPRLRADCHRIRELQGRREPTGTAKITRGYFLPSRFVIHTVGPIVGNGPVAPADERALASCYEACLNLASDVHARSVALCAISTGVFGYPKQSAAVVALRTVKNWVRRHPDTVDLVVFNVFGEDDAAAYRDAGGLN